MHEAEYLWDRYVESKYRDQVPKVAFTDALKYVVDYLKGENIVWNTDYPHPDAINLQRRFPSLTRSQLPMKLGAKYCGDNAIKLFGPRILN